MGLASAVDCYEVRDLTSHKVSMFLNNAYWARARESTLCSFAC
jgi:hypothetical protein